MHKRAPVAANSRLWSGMEVLKKEKSSSPRAHNKIPSQTNHLTTERYKATSLRRSRSPWRGSGRASWCFPWGSSPGSSLRRRRRRGFSFPSSRSHRGSSRGSSLRGRRRPRSCRCRRARWRAPRAAPRGSGAAGSWWAWTTAASSGSRRAPGCSGTGCICEKQRLETVFSLHRCASVEMYMPDLSALYLG
jgi:hypothetical protein